MGLATTMRTAQANLGTKGALSAVPRCSRQKTSKTTTSRTPSKIAISTTDAERPSISRTLHRRAVPRFAPYRISLAVMARRSFPRDTDGKNLLVVRFVQDLALLARIIVGSAPASQ